tara:strand:+ start:156 stop:938 length:783 start_codon:yes stop_codon:yes gene_type:complete
LSLYPDGPRAIQNEDGSWSSNVPDFEYTAKTRASVYRKVKEFLEKDDTPQIEQIEESPSIEQVIEMEEVDAPTLEWLNVEEVETEEIGQPSVVKSATKTFLRSLRSDTQAQRDNRKLTKTELKAQRQVHKRVIGYGWRTIDRLMTWFGRRVTQDEEFDAGHSTDEYNLLENATLDSFDYHGINPTLFMSPDVVLGVTVVALYQEPTRQIIRARVKSGARRELKGGILRSLNPLNWFRRRKQPQTIIPEEVTVEPERITTE